MKTANRKLSRLLACALVFLLALTCAVPVFAERTSVKQDNLQVVIHNNEGLPGMSTNQFTVYQLFTGTPYKEKEQANEEYGADNWNNYTLADVKWGSSVTDNGDALLKALQGVTDEWATKDGKNVFEGITDAAGLAKVLEANNTNDFMQHFATTVAAVSGLQAVPVVPVLTDGKDAEGKSLDAEDYLTYTFTDPGYYMFADTHNLSTTEADARSEYIIAVLGDQEINLKASVPTVDKEIVGGNNGKKGDAAGISDYVQFKLTGTLPKNFEDFSDYQYTFHDTLSAGLTYVSDSAHTLTVTVYPTEKDAAASTNGVTVPITYGENIVNYSVSETGSEQEGPKCNLEVKFDDLKKLMNAESEAIKVTDKSVIVVTYYAQVNENAVIGSKGNPNEVFLEYSNDPNHEGTGKTVEKKVYVYAFGLDLTKIGSDADHATGKGLSGAGFVMSKKVDNDTYYAQFEDVKDGETVTGRRLTGWVKQASPATSPDVDVEKLMNAYTDAKKALDKAKEADRQTAQATLDAAKQALEAYLLESGDKGEIPDITGLDEGTYALKEVIVPDGYNTPEKDFDITIKANISTEGEGKLQSVTYTHDGKATTYKETYAEGDADSADAGTLAPRFESGLLKDEITNQKAPFLPFTGGIGTLVFYVLGIALIAGAVTYLVIVSKKRNKAEETA